MDNTLNTVGISEAAKQLGISNEAVRQRIRRRKLEAYKSPDGVWQIVLPHHTNSTANGSPTVQDNVQVNVQLPVGSVRPHDNEELVIQLKSEVTFLREEMAKQREEWSEQARRKDIIIHELTSQLKALPQAVVAVQEEHQQQEPAEPAPAHHRPWWRFWESL